jgi:hypothetical protein
VKCVAVGLVGMSVRARSRCLFASWRPVTAGGLGLGGTRVPPKNGYDGGMSTEKRLRRLTTESALWI